MNRKRIALGAAVAAVVVGASFAAVGLASASSTPVAVRRAAPEVRRAVTPVPSNPYIVAPPGATLYDGDTDTLTVAGRTFGGTTVPGNATSVTVSLASVSPSGSGFMTVYTTGARRPGSPTVSFRRGQNVSGTETVGLDNRGRLTVYSSEHTRYTLRLLSYNTGGNQGGGNPSCTSTIFTIPAVNHTLTNVGGSIRTGATDFGSVVLPAGTYDTRVIGGFTGANNGDTWYTSSIFLTGTMVLVKGATIASDFSNVAATEGGVLIPKSNSSTLTQDPTLPISTFLTLAAPTEVHVKLFAYASDSGTAGSGQLKGNLQSAQFRNLC